MDIPVFDVVSDTGILDPGKCFLTYSLKKLLKTEGMCIFFQINIQSTTLETALVVWLPFLTDGFLQCPLQVYFNMHWSSVKLDKTLQPTLFCRPLSYGFLSVNYYNTTRLIWVRIETKNNHYFCKKGQLEVLCCNVRSCLLKNMFSIARNPSSFRQCHPIRK